MVFLLKKGNYIDEGTEISDKLDNLGLKWKPLLRTNKKNYHPVMAGIYEDMIYHHSAGTRWVDFRINHIKSVKKDEGMIVREQEIRKDLMIKLFEDTDSFLKNLQTEEDVK